MSRITQIALKNFRGYREPVDPILIDADIVLVTGKNGSGKTSLLQAITLLLNGYDDTIFKDIDFVNFHAKTTVSSVSLFGCSGLDKMPGKSNKEWQIWQSPFELNREILKPSLARAASVYFQDQSDKLANGEFLIHLTGSGNQGQQILDWIKEKSKAWKERADNALPSEKNWDEERKKIISRFKTIQLEKLSGSRFAELFKDFEPFINNGNLANHWQSQVVNLAGNLGVAITNYGFNLLDAFRKQIQSKQNEWEEEQKRGREENKGSEQLQSRLRSLLQNYGESIDIIPQSQWIELDEKRLQLEHSLESLKNKQDSLKLCEPQTSALDHILGTLNDEIIEAIEECKRLAASECPLPADVVGLFEGLQLFDYQALGQSYNFWRNAVAKNLEGIALQIKDEYQRLENLNTQQQILELLQENPSTRKFMASPGNINRNDVFKELESPNATDAKNLTNNTVLTGLQEFDRTILALIQLEQEYEQSVQQKRQMQSFMDAKEYAGKWYSALSKECAASGTLPKAMNEMDLEPIISALRNLLSLFHLPPEFVQQIQLNRKGTGKNAVLVPALGNIDFANLSTGQKTLFSMAWTAVLNMSFREKLGHNVMLFDDITTSLDMNQIVPACILFRKLAYTGDDSQRRQLFISSHHEDLTNRLIDNLIPPEGRSMKVLEIKDFTVENGPLVEVWSVATAKSGISLDREE